MNKSIILITVKRYITLINVERLYSSPLLQILGNNDPNDPKKVRNSKDYNNQCEYFICFHSFQCKLYRIVISCIVVFDAVLKLFVVIFVNQLFEIVNVDQCGKSWNS